ARARQLMQAQRDGEFSRENFDELTQLVRDADDPHRAVASVLAQLDYVDEDARSFEAFSPYQTMLTPGVCRDQHTLAAYLLQQSGYDVAVTGYGAAGDVLHRNMVFRDPETGDWAALEYGFISTFPGTENFADVLQAFNPGAVAFRFFGVPSSADEVSRISAVVDTEQGRRLNELMRGSGIALNERGLVADASNGVMSTRYSADNGLSFQLSRLQSGPEAPVLNNGWAAIGRFTQSDGEAYVRYSAGLIDLADVPHNSIGGYNWNETDVTIAFAAIEGQRTLYETAARSLEIAGRETQLRFNVPTQYGIQVAYAWSDDGRETGLMNGLTQMDLDIAPGWELESGPVTAHARLGLSANEALTFNIAEGGYRDLGQLPIRIGPRIGAAYEGARWSVAGEIDYSLTPPIDARPQGIASIGAGYDLGDALGFASAHELGVGVALEYGFGDSVLPEQNTGLSPALSVDYSFEGQNGAGGFVRGGYVPANGSQDAQWRLQGGWEF
ncbi:MAG: hypothetical protein AAFQ82_16115, partial [Myxococcota bacterium]